MTKADLVDKIHAKAGLGTKAATEQFLDAAISVLSETIANGEQVSFTGFGSFKVVERSERKAATPHRRGMPHPRFPRRKFTPGKALKEAVK
ncbi:MAG: HU family DNA-binding protein [Bilophila wadsworthia]